MKHCAVKFQDSSSDNPEGLSREELGRMVASRWTGESANEVSKDDKKGHEDEPEIPEPAEESLEDESEIPEPAEESYGGYHSEIEDDRHKYDDDDDEFDHESEDEYNNDHDDHVESYKSDEDQKGDQHSGRVI
jgi:protein kinase C substrate 80K-H